MKSGANGHWDGSRRVPRRVLLVEDDRADARLTTALVTGGRDGVEVTHVLTLAEAFELRHLEFDIILSDLNLPDSSGTTTVSRLNLEFAGVPLIALTVDDERGLACIAAGAQDFIAKIELNRKTLNRAIEFSLQRAWRTLSSELASRHDALTGLLSRAPFEEAANAAIVRPDDTRPYNVVLFIDVNGFKAINDAHGHTLGDRVLKGVARELRSAVRAEDLVCRWGGDEFVVFGRAESPAAANQMADRVRRKMKFVQPVDGPGGTSVQIPVNSSVGAAIDNEPVVGALGTLIYIADSAMYGQKPGYTPGQLPRQRASRLTTGFR